jgi:hypothetical protein
VRMMLVAVRDILVQDCPQEPLPADKDPAGNPGPAVRTQPSA